MKSAFETDKRKGANLIRNLLDNTGEIKNVPASMSGFITTGSASGVSLQHEKSKPKIKLESVSLSFGGGLNVVHALEGINLSINEGEIVTLIGPSGSGKSTVLNLISDTLSIKGLKVDGRVSIEWRTEARNRLGYVLQKDTLLPWRTLLRNVEVGLEVMGMTQERRRALAHDWIARLGLDKFEHAYPHMLSGGMRQRANIIRTLICNPEVVLMDEPFGALDAQTRLVLQQMLIDLWQTSKPTICFVTHDLEESILLGHRVVLLSASPGRIEKIYDVDIPHPRDVIEVKATPQFQKLYLDIWDHLKSSLSNRSNLPQKAETSG